MDKNPVLIDYILTSTDHSIEACIRNCSDHGNCVYNTEFFECSCIQYYRGDMCDRYEVIMKCKEDSPCQHNGINI